MFAEFGYLTLLLSVTFEEWLSVCFMKVGGRREARKSQIYYLYLECVGRT